jgi:hypothetical protein
LCNEQIRDTFNGVLSGFNFEKVEKAVSALIV